MSTITNVIANELMVRPEQVAAAIALLDSGNTVPFIARYRKEATGDLNDTQLRTLNERLGYLRELGDRKETILKSIAEQGKLTDELQSLILAADNKARLEDLYRPYKPKRHTKGQIAIAAGLEPLADMLLQDPNLDPAVVGQDFIAADKGVNDIKAALDGARYILMERFADDAELTGKLREQFWQEGLLVSKVIEEKQQLAQKFTDYFDFAEKISVIPSHRALAILRGRQEGFLQINIETTTVYEPMISAHFAIQNLNRKADLWLQEVIRLTWAAKLRVQLEVDLIARMRELAETQAIQVFADNLKDLLLAPPAGAKVTMGLDPGIRTGVKVVIIDVTGKLLASYTVYPHQPQNKWQAALKLLAESCLLHKVQLISIGNGTGSRETDKLVTELIQHHPELNLIKVITSEAGASVYSASELAAKEFPSLDVSLRGAVSIARRLQDPLAELVKIEPKAIGVGQYQHDVNQMQLARTLDAVVEDCVNAVGVDVNTASEQLLKNVAGLNQTTACNIVNFRDSNGAFKARTDLKQVARLGDKAFEQAAGFLRITNGSNPLDASGVHPESYPIVEQILATTKLSINELIGNKTVLDKLQAKDFTSASFGMPTVKDVIAELQKPGRDPRPEFKYVQFNPDITELKDLKIGMILEGTVTNVADFGAFVDIGVHQDGLVHISAMATRFIKSAREVVKTGDVITVKVLGIDVDRKRIQLTMKLADKPELMQPANDKSQQKVDPQNNEQHKNRNNVAAAQHSNSKATINRANSQTKAATTTSAFGDLLQNALKK